MMLLWIEIRALLVLGCGLAVLSAGTRGLAAENLPDLIDRIRPSVVGVGLVMPARGAKQTPVQFKGTGFAVSDGRYVVTNYHVMDASRGTEKNQILAVFSGRGKDSRAIPAKVVATDDIHDLALLELQAERVPPAILAPETFVREGTDVAFTGFPIGMVLGLYPVSHRGIVAAITPIVIPAVSARQLSAEHLRRMRNPFEVYQLDATAYPGNSGSPVYRRDNGRVIGVINSVFVKGTKESAIENPSGITYVIPVRHVYALLKQAGVRQ